MSVSTYRNGQVGQYMRRYGPVLLKAAYKGFSQYRSKKRMRDGGFKKKRSRYTAYHTGSMGRRFGRKGRRPKNDKYKVYGSEICYEHGGLIGSGGHTVSTGHSVMPVRQVLMSVSRAIWRRVLMQYNCVFTDWNDPYGDVGTTTLTIYFRNSAGLAASTNFVTPVASKTHQEWALELYTLIVNSSLPDKSEFILISVEVTSTLHGLNMRMDVTNASIHLNVNSSMRIQNRTNGYDGTQTEADNVTNNPLIGRSWTLTGNQLVSKSAVAGGSSSSCDIDHGILSGTVPASDPATGSGITLRSKINSADTYRHCKKSGICNLAPGEIKSSKLWLKRSMRLNSLFSILSEFITEGSSTSTSADMRFGIGSSRYFMFDKLVDTGAGFASAQIGYQIDMNVRSFLTVKAPVANRISGVV